MSGSSSTHVVLRIADRPAEGVVRRFGPGVSAVPQWSGAAAPKPPTRRQRSAWGGVLLAFLAIAAVIAYLVLGRSDPLVLTGAAVAPAADLGQTCDVTVDVVGTIRTNGQAGAVRYRWIRCDGESTTLLSQSVESGQTEVKVHLFWTLTGKGRYPGSAALQILQPQPMEATGGFTYSCG